MPSDTRRQERRRHRRRSIALVPAVVSAMLLTACAPSSPPADPGGDADLGDFHDQQLEWGPCEDTATTAADAELFADPALECAAVEVPLDYAEPDGERASIALLRLPASGESQGSVLVNVGGPGGTGTSGVASTAELWRDGPVAEQFDIVGFDPRGIGASTPTLDCYSDAEYDAGEGLRFGAVNDITSAEQAEELAERCLSGSGGLATLANAGSRDVVRDMDVMREVLGDDRLTFLGYSYGSELGAMYATTYPDRVRALVLDGGVAPDLTSSEFRVTQYRALQARFDDLAALCAESPDCVLGVDPAAASDRLHEILEPLAEDPLPAADGRDLTVWDAYLGLDAGLYSEARWPEIIAALAALEDGSADEMLALRDHFYARGADGAHGTDLDTNTAVRCVDRPSVTPEEQEALARELAEVAPVFDIEPFTTGPFHDECEAWPVPPTRDEPWLPQTDADLPTSLVVSVTGDPGTPHEGGVALAEALGAQLLTVEGNQHGAYLLGGSDCVDDAVDAYLLEPEEPLTVAECSL